MSYRAINLVAWAGSLMSIIFRDGKQFQFMPESGTTTSVTGWVWQITAIGFQVSIMGSTKKLVSIAALVILAACQTNSNGTGTGFSSGSLVRKASATDGLKGGPLSRSLGEGLNAPTMNKALNAELSALETGLAGSATIWNNGSGISGKVVPGQIYEVGNSPCRRYTHQIVLNGTTRNGEGTACKGENGLWTALD